MIDRGRRLADYKIIAVALIKEAIRVICLAVVVGAIAWFWFAK